MNRHFYRAFEDQHRGPRAIIKSRLRVYLPFVEPLKKIHGDVSAVDLGCGRGEWLELLQEVGVAAHGVDLDAGMLAGCRELGLSVETSDAVSYLQTLADNSRSVVSAFHLVEHVTFEQLQALTAQAHRVLKPGGLLIMETPNPENIVVATRNFYLDPTHQRPIPPDLLFFVAEFYGFARAKVVRLQESTELAQQDTLTLQDVLGGVSPDYAVVAQKSAAHDLLAQLDAPFSLAYGLNLETLTARYEVQTSGRMVQAMAVAQHAEATAQLAQTAAQHAEATAQLAQTAARHADSVAQRAQAQAQQAQIAAQQASQLLQDVFNSRSWRITAPLRWCALQLRALRSQGLRRRSKAVLKKVALPVVRRCFAFVRARPALKNRMSAIALRMGVYTPLLVFYRRLTGAQPAPDVPAPPSLLSSTGHKGLQLTPREQAVYADIKAAIKKNGEIV